MTDESRWDERRMDEQGRLEPPGAADEVGTLFGFLDWQRSTFEWKCRGLDAPGFATRIASSAMTLGGMMKHLALVEEAWFCDSLMGRPLNAVEPWASGDLRDPEWEWTSAADDTVDELWSIWRTSVERARGAATEALADGGLDRLSDGAKPPNLRWIMVHMIEEYARHNGHADLLREAIDGETGE